MYIYIFIYNVYYIFDAAAMSLYRYSENSYHGVHISLTIYYYLTLPIL